MITVLITKHEVAYNMRQQIIVDKVKMVEITEDAVSIVFTPATGASKMKDIVHKTIPLSDIYSIKITEEV